MTASSAFHAATLVAAARTAATAAGQIANRRAGRDPSAQESDADARADLSTLLDALAGQVVQLRLRLVADVPEHEAAAFVQSFEDRILLRDVADVLTTAHQKLLSLYPAVDETIVESARHLAAEAAQRTTTGNYDVDLDAFTVRLVHLGDALERAL